MICLSKTFFYLLVTMGVYLFIIKPYSNLKHTNSSTSSGGGVSSDGHSHSGGGREF